MAGNRTRCPWSLCADGGSGEAGGNLEDLYLARMRWRLGGSESDRKALGTDADWLTEGGQENDWTGLMMTGLSLTLWESGSDAGRPLNLP